MVSHAAAPPGTLSCLRRMARTRRRIHVSRPEKIQPEKIRGRAYLKYPNQPRSDRLRSTTSRPARFQHDEREAVASGPFRLATDRLFQLVQAFLAHAALAGFEPVAEGPWPGPRAGLEPLSRLQAIAPGLRRGRLHGFVSYGLLVRSPRCSPPRIAATQLPSAT